MSTHFILIALSSTIYVIILFFRICLIMLGLKILFIAFNFVFSLLKAWYSRLKMIQNEKQNVKSFMFSKCCRCMFRIQIKEWYIWTKSVDHLEMFIAKFTHQFMVIRNAKIWNNFLLMFTIISRDFSNINDFIIIIVIISVLICSLVYG